MILCPFCKGRADAEFVDIGVGFQQVTPAECRNRDCGGYQVYAGTWFRHGDTCQLPCCRTDADEEATT